MIVVNVNKCRRLISIVLVASFLVQFGCKLLLADGLKVDKSSPSLDKSGWRTLVKLGDENERFGRVSDPLIEKATSARASDRAKKLIEWDDDDLNGFIQNIREQDLDLQSLKSHKNASRLATSAKKSSPFNRLVYHGQVKQNSTTIKLSDGTNIHLDTHRPLAIYRKSTNSQQPQAINLTQSIASEQPSSRLEPGWSVESSSLDISPSPELTKSSTDWRPVFIMRSRRSGKTALKVPLPVGKNASSGALIEESGKSKWRPIVSEKSAVGEEKEKSTGSIRPKENGTKDSDVIYGKTYGSNQGISRKNSRIEEPFDDDGLIVLRGLSEEKSKQRTAKSHKSQRESNKLLSSERDLNRWTPVETTTMVATTPLDDLTTTSAATTSSTIASNTGNSSSSLESAAHRSASNLNYIYSSQPDTLSSRSSYSSASNGYYSNYLVPPTTAQVVEQPLAIVDTTSGQAPEMIADRTPEQPPALPALPATSYDSTYSLPQTSVSAFQPAAPLPPRIPALPATSLAGYDYSGPRAQQATRAQQPAQTQLVKQEHHYHYYNQQQQQQREREQPQAERQSVVQQSQQPTSQIIREIQPLLISQPILQQPSTTTTTTTPAPPQIIREIIRESPALPATQFSRLIQLPQPIPVPPARDLPEPVTVQLMADNPAQRIIRQLVSSSLPTVSMRMPQLAPIRLPAIQLPVRLTSSPSPPALFNQPPVTRQTGSFVIPPMPKKTTTYYTETQAMPTHTTIMHTTQFTPATRTTVFTTDHDTSSRALPATSSYKAK